MRAIFFLLLGLIFFFGQLDSSPIKALAAGLDCSPIPRRRVVGNGTCSAPTSDVCNSGEQCVDCYDITFPAIPLHACLNIPTGITIPSEISTEIGKLNPAPTELIQALIRILVGLAGGISLFLFLSGAGKYIFSVGNPDNVEEAKQTITHALGGLLIVLLSVFLLRFIGIDILHIPGFTPSGGGGVNIP